MLARLSTVAALALLISQTPSSVDAHGELVLPKPTYHQWGGNVCSTISPSKLPFAWAQNFTNAFDAAITKTGLSLKDFILKNQNMSGASVDGSTAECGYSDPAGTPQPLPDHIQFFTTFMHQGPCEAYCDDELVIPHSADCRSLYPGGTVPYEKAKCVGKKRFTLYWLAMDSGNGAPWQVYTNCVPLSGASGSSSSNSGGSSATTAAPSATTTSPSATAAGEASGGDDDETTAPTATTSAPATASPAASTSAPSSKCTKRTRRN